MSRPRHDRLRVAAAAAVVLACAVAAPGAPPQPRHPVVLWTFDDDAARTGFAGAVRTLGADAVQCAPDRDPAPFRAAGLGWYEDHTAGKGVLALRDRDWRPAWERAWDERRSAWPSEAARSRPTCVANGAAWMRMIETGRAPAARAKDGALWISLEDEPGIVARANPGDWCLCPSCESSFREEQRLRFGGRLATLNARWGTSYASWDEVRPWTTAAIRARELAKPVGEWNLAPWCDTREFQDARFSNAVAVVARGLRPEAGDVPIGLSGIQTPSAFGGFDLARLLGGLDYAEPYDIGRALEVVRDVAAPRVLAQTVFPDGADGRTSRWKLWRGVARGANATIVWSSKDTLRRDEASGAWSLTDHGRAIAPDLAALSAAGGVGADLAATAPFDEGIVVVVSQPSVRVRWMLDSVSDGDTWMRRFGSHEAAHSTAVRSRESACAALAQRGWRFADADALLSRAGGARPRVVVLPDTIALDDDQVRRLDAWAAAGTLVVADAEPARFDGAGRARSPGVPGCIVDPGFERLAARVERAIGPPVLRATAVRADGGEPPPVEVRVRVAPDGSRRAVCVASWDVAGSDDGSTTGAVPRTTIRVTFAFGDGVRREVRDLRSGAAASSAATWTASDDAAAPFVLSWK